VPDFDLAIIGTGSGNSLVTPDFDHKKVAIIEEGTFGGTCLNVGCIPTKMYVYAADVANTIRQAARYGIDAELTGVRWTDIRDRVFGRIDPISAAGQDYRVNGPNTATFFSHAHFTGPHNLALGTGEEISAEQIVIAAGARSVIPDAVIDSGVPFHTSDTIMRIDALPKRLIILGGGYVGAEFAHIFGSLGSKITFVTRGNRLLRHLDSEVSDRFTELAGERWNVLLGAALTKVTQAGTGAGAEITLHFADGTSTSGDLLLVATGRQPNSDRLALDAAGVRTRSDGRVEVDCHGRTSADNIWALGDVCSPYQLKHVANHEARIVAHNLTHPDELWTFDHRFVPAAVFTDPQIASVGLTEDEARIRYPDYVTATQLYSDTAYGWAMEDTDGICKVIADPSTGKLLGAHVMGYQASTLIQPLIHGISFGQRVSDLATGQYWIHPALAEVVENALLKLGLS
jgi:mycothione reductase